MKTIRATRYITPLREGGSVPAVIEADDGETYVLKFRGAAQGPKALIAELLGGEIARLLELNVPELALIELDPVLARNEPHEEIREMIGASGGLNLGMRFLSSAFAYNPMLKPPPAADLAAQIVWLDSYILNVDRSARNVNLLLWQNDLWLIDHGAAFYFHHDWSSAASKVTSPFALVRQHVLLPFASDVSAADALAQTRLSDERLQKLVDQLPDEWLLAESAFASKAEHRQAYFTFLTQRRSASAIFVEEANRARNQLS